MRPLLSLAIAASLAACAPPDFDPETCDVGVTVGDCAPDVAGTDAAGVEVSLGNFEGDAVIAVFGEMWCPLCQFLAEDLQPFYEDHADKGFEVVFFLDQDFGGESAEPDEVATFVEEFGLTYTVLASDEADSEEYEYGVQRPRAFVLDRARMIRERTTGYRPAVWDDLTEAALDQLDGADE